MARLLDKTGIVGYIGFKIRGFVCPGSAVRERGPAFFHAVGMPGRGGRACRKGSAGGMLRGRGNGSCLWGAISFRRHG